MSDGVTGIDKSIAQIFGGLPHQKSVVHLQGNLKAYVARDHRAGPAEDIGQVMGVDDPKHRIDDAVKQVGHLSAK